MEWLCVVSGLDSREDLGNAYTTIRDLVIDQPDPVRRVSIKRLTVSRSEEKRTHSICIHSLAVPPDMDQLAQLVSMLITDHYVHVWAMGPEISESTLSRFRDGVPIGSRRINIASIDRDRLFGSAAISLSAMETACMAAERFLERAVGHEGDYPTPRSNAENTTP
jgi:hypothetical protein